MKKLLFVLLFAAMLLTGCEKKLKDVAPAELFEVEDGITHDGVKVGDGKDAFISAYSDYIIQASFTDVDSGYLVMLIDDIPYEEDISTLIANFFIDGAPMSEEEICEENGVDVENLHTLLSSSAFLRSHNVSYRYLRFLWKGGAITDIDTGELNYNETYEVPKMD